MILTRILNKLRIVVARLLIATIKPETEHSISGIVFSKDRPLQLEALLNSYYKMVINRAPLSVLYKTTNTEIDDAYQKISETYPEVIFKKETNFKKNLLSIIKKNKSHQIFFLVDDILFIKKFDLTALNNFDTKKYIPSMRLGANITYSYIKQKSISQPKFANLSNNIISWQWNENNSYWSYPLSVDGHIYSKKEIQIISKLITFNSPNTYEHQLQKFYGLYKCKLGCSFKQSVIINIPWNKVQTDNNNTCGELTSDELMNLWKNEERIDINKYINREYISAHVILDIYTKNLNT